MDEHFIDSETFPGWHTMKSLDFIFHPELTIAQRLAKMTSLAPMLDTVLESEVAALDDTVME